MTDIKPRLKRARSIAWRLFLIVCVVYTVVTVLFDYRSTGSYPRISESVCSARYIDAESEGELRRRLVEEFVPTLVFSFGEPAILGEEVVVPYQIVPDRDDTGRYVWRGAVTYPTDYGASSFGVRFGIGDSEHSFLLSKAALRALGWVFGQAHIDSHIGDVEMFELYLKPSREEGYWEIDSLSLYPHGTLRTYSAEEIRCFRDSPLIYVSRGKHAMFASLRECNDASVANERGVHLMAEHCSVGELYYPATADEFSVGDSANPNNVFETSPTIRASEVFVGEDAWGNCFYGGYREDYENNGPCRARFRWW
ncbi:MAG: hypothetical protein GXY36_20170 [Chloroflexi bacterium]|nr:hypothetical protein [Chloroflexota bacterium]